MRIRPQQYSGQNIENMATDNMAKTEELINVRYFDYGLTLNIGNGFLTPPKTPKAHSITI